MVDVFISYPRALRAKVEPIKAKLDALGLDCFFDIESIDGGAEFPAVITRAIDGSKAVLACCSPLYFTRPWCLSEAHEGLARGILVPVILEPFERTMPPLNLRDHRINFLDLSAWCGEDAHEDWNRTLLSLGKLVGRELAPSLKRALLGGLRVEGEAPAPTGPEKARADLLTDLRATWAAFPAKSNAAAVKRFLDRIHAVAAGSGLEFEVEHHLNQLSGQSENEDGISESVLALAGHGAAGVVAHTEESQQRRPQEDGEQQDNADADNHAIEAQKRAQPEATADRLRRLVERTAKAATQSSANAAADQAMRAEIAAAAERARQDPAANPLSLRDAMKLNTLVWREPERKDVAAEFGAMTPEDTDWFTRQGKSEAAKNSFLFAKSVIVRFFLDADGLTTDPNRIFGPVAVRDFTERLLGTTCDWPGVASPTQIGVHLKSVVLGFEMFLRKHAKNLGLQQATEVLAEHILACYGRKGADAPSPRSVCEAMERSARL